MTAKKDKDEPEVEAPVELPTDQFGRPVLPVSQAYSEALEQGYFGNDGKDLGAGVRPEDVRSFQEHADAGVDTPAHSEPVVIENPGGQGGYTALGTPTAPDPVVGGDATSADKPSINTPSENGAETAPTNPEGT